MCRLETELQICPVLRAVSEGILMCNVQDLCAVCERVLGSSVQCLRHPCVQCAGFVCNGGRRKMKSTVVPTQACSLAQEDVAGFGRHLHQRHCYTRLCVCVCVCLCRLALRP